MIELKNISKQFDIKGKGHKKKRTFVAVNQVNLTWKRGEFISIVGESGCGKSTLAKIIAGLISPSEGSLLLDEVENKINTQAQRARWAKVVQVVPQDPYASLNPVRKIRSSMGDALLYHKMAKRNELDHKIEEMLDLVGLNSKETLNKYPHQLSGGQRQRLVIARALSLDPDFLIADESVSMMDVSLRVGVLDYFKKIASERELGLLFITHDFRIARYISFDGKIAVMYLGNIVEFGDTQEVLSHPLHPYTQSLISAVPLIAGKERRIEEVIPKSFEVGKVYADRQQCPFADRCPFARTDCYEQKPLLKTYNGNGSSSTHQVACHYAEARELIENV
ncbi:peptide/nickel transport system ATP-binding protein [Pullulanibacillus pueri]|uniref:Oligopeptide ABC transporter ATP-binding protein n=1 Tax=Pullulanibacillus pueri TaxID=1437324 RepID=A0A8J2ZW26_9BACL|nr:ABC transporter ATP-binding protein [Pullulanibacillus pueri]MBM7682642.1 peptide/nickel transport system ATP-binding protein [Pullulanibacillus pueri]GGH82624.1 oligopeptide ABC transporter ATP-binding protein [Pullulanibacillus pueri]